MHDHPQYLADTTATPSTQEADALRLARLEDADSDLTPLLASIVSEFMRRAPLPPD